MSFWRIQFRAIFILILFPLVRAHVAELTAAAPGRFVFVETHDADAYDLRSLADQVWLVSATPEERIQNLINEHGWSPPAAARFVHTSVQPVRRATPDRVLRSDGSDDAVREQVIRALEAMDWQRPRQTEPPIAEHAAPQATRAVDTSGAPQEVSSQAPAAQVLEPGRRPACVQPAVAAAAVPEASQRQGPAAASLGLRELRLVGQRLVGSALILLAIAFLTSWGWLLAEYGRQHLPIQPAQAAAQAVTETVRYITGSGGVTRRRKDKTSVQT